MWWKDSVVAKARDTARRLEVDGVLWLVYEVGPPYDGRGTSLVFESEHVVRRVRNYPARWRDSPDAELALLREHL